MHIIFSEEELRWINKRTMGWPLKQDCPEKIKKSIEKKKEKLNKQKEGVR